MSESPDIWLVAGTLPEMRWAARVSLWLMSACACAWTVFAAYDVHQLGTISGEQALALLSLVAWLVWMRPFAAKGSHAKDMTLFWFNDPNHGVKARSQRQTAKPLIQPSHWRTRDGQAAQVQVKLDMGTHLLLRIRQGKAVTYRWVRDTEVTGPWRWRIHTDSPKQANAQLRQQPQLAMRQAHDKDAWHHR